MTRTRAVVPVHLGFSVGRGEPVAIPIGHMCVTGQTQQAGKTTALEALVTRSGLRAVTFITKRGEGSFRTAQPVAPYFRERADWQFVASLIDATMGEKNRMLRSFLMKVCRGTTTLAEVQANVEQARAAARRGFDESILTEIAGYLELVVPQLAELPPSRRLELADGLSVIDLTAYRPEVQGLVIRSVLEHVYERETDVVTVIPEAWQFLPEQRGSPVRLAFETLVRKGAALRNYAWLDSQDLAGVWKLAIRACSVVLFGVQREANEIKRSLANMPATVAKPKAADIATLGLGEFVACWATHAVRTYVQPVWMSEKVARQVARGELDVRNASAIATLGNVTRAARQVFGGDHPIDLHARKGEQDVTKAEAEALRDENRRWRETHESIVRENDDLKRRLAALEKRKGTDGTQGAVHDGRAVGARGADPDRKSGTQRTKDHAGAVARDRAVTPVGALDRDVHPSASVAHADVEALYQTIKARLIAEVPGILLLLETRPELEVTVERRTLQARGDSTLGRVARLIKSGALAESKRFREILVALERTGPRINNKSLSSALQELVAAGFLVRESVDRYAAAADMAIRIVES
jgi:hypothetical protein